jgi:hypothetical protein
MVKTSPNSPELCANTDYREHARAVKRAYIFSELLKVVIC